MIPYRRRLKVIDNPFHNSVYNPSFNPPPGDLIRHQPTQSISQFINLSIMQLPTLVILAFSAIAIAAPAENKAQTPAQSTDTCYWMAAGNKEAKGNIIKGVIGCCWQGAVCKAVTPGQRKYLLPFDDDDR